MRDTEKDKVWVPDLKELRIYLKRQIYICIKVSENSDRVGTHSINITGKKRGRSSSRKTRCGGKQRSGRGGRGWVGSGRADLSLASSGEPSLRHGTELRGKVRGERD